MLGWLHLLKDSLYFLIGTDEVCGQSSRALINLRTNAGRFAYRARGMRCRNILDGRRALVEILYEILREEEVQSPVKCYPQLLFQAR
jgi:hypothetical protein